MIKVADGTFTEQGCSWLTAGQPWAVWFLFHVDHLANMRGAQVIF